jgi:hypothetical protein
MMNPKTGQRLNADLDALALLLHSIEQIQISFLIFQVLLSYSIGHMS